MREQLGFAFDVNEYNADFEKLQEESGRHSMIATLKNSIKEKEATDDDKELLAEMVQMPDYKKNSHCLVVKSLRFYPNPNPNLIPTFV